MKPFLQAFGIPFGYSVRIYGADCTDRRFQICVSELITLIFWSGYVGNIVVLFVLKKAKSKRKEIRIWQKDVRRVTDL